MDSPEPAAEDLDREAELLGLVPDIAEPSGHTAFDMLLEPEFPAPEDEEVD